MDINYKKEQIYPALRSQNSIIARRILKFNDDIRQITFRIAFNSDDTDTMVLNPIAYAQAKKVGYADITYIKTGRTSHFFQYWGVTPEEFRPDAGADLR